MAWPVSHHATCTFLAEIDGWEKKKSICFLLREVSALKELDGISDMHLLEGFFDI